MNKRRETIDKLAKASRKDFTYKPKTEEEIAFLEYYEKYAKSLYTGEKEDYEKIPDPPEGFYEWLDEYEEGLLDDGRIEDSKEITSLGEEYSLDDAAEIISKRGLGGREAIINLIRKYPNEKAKDFAKIFNERISKKDDKIRNAFFDKGGNEKTSFFIGLVYASSWNNNREIPEDLLRDLDFIEGYISSYEQFVNLDENSITKIIEETENIQHVLNLRREKEKNRFLNERINKIAEAEALVDREQGQQQE